MLSPLTNEEGNSLIKKFLKENKAFCVGRVGFTEVVVAYCYDTGQRIPDVYSYLLQNNAGVYGNDSKEFCREYIEAIKTGDIHAMWDTTGIVADAQAHLFTKYSQKASIVSNKSVEPFYFDTPWSEELRDKKVLIISPFINTFKEQYLNNREKIWSNKNILPKMKLTLYKNIQSIGAVGPHNNWKESLDFMKKEISQIDFDIALLGCGAYGMPLGAYIKNILNKTSIYIGGGLQVLFGVIGERWLEQGKLKAGNHINEFWTRPSIDERPEKYYSVESGCYW